MKKHRTWWIAIPAVTVCTGLAGGALFIWLAMSILGECKTDVRKSIPSPDGKRLAVVFGKECNATVGFNTQISIAPAGRSFSAESYPAFFITSGLHVVQAAWIGNSAVEITLIPGGDRVSKKEQRAGDTKIVYP